MSSEDLYDRTLATGSIYHIYNRGVAKQPLFQDDRDYRHLLTCLGHYLEAEPQIRLSYLLRLPDASVQLNQPIAEPLVRVHAYALMPNHFHLVVEQLVDDGISTWLRKGLNSYSRYYNLRHHRVGPLFQGPFRFVRVVGDYQFLHVTRYVHLNAVVAKLSKTAIDYPWSSMKAVLDGTTSRLCDPSQTLQMVGTSDRYKSFVNDYADYASSIAAIKHLLHDEEE